MKQNQRKTLLWGVFLFSLTNPVNTFAQGYLSDATTANAVLTRDPARQASTEVDAVVTNPAGIMFMENGLHASVSGVFSLQNITTRSLDTPAVSLHSKDTRILPAIQLAYKKDRWAISASFNYAGGNGKRKSKDGSILVDAVTDGISIDKLDEMNTYFMQQNALLEFMAALSGQQEIGINSKEDKWAFRTKNMNSSLYNWNMQLGAALKITKNFSAFVGVKTNHVVSDADIKAGLVVLRPSTGERWSFADYSQKQNQLMDKLDVSEEFKDMFKEDLRNIAELSEDVQMGMNVYSLDGWGFAPILGLDYKWENFNFGMKYEFASHVNLKHSDAHFSVPSTLSLGVNWQAAKRLQFAVGSNIIFAANHNVFGSADTSGAYDLSASCTYDITDKILISGGYTYSHEQQTAPELAPIVLPSCSLHRLSLGAAYSPVKNLEINLGVSVYTNDLISNVVSKYSVHTGDNNQPMQITTLSSSKYAPRMQVALGVNYHL
ncbi:MAG: hypothetical protein LUD00_11025 [Prevotellaceae bacterium]|nr:hypothetical protein [Prevotellaceae bacterium]